MLKLLTWLRLNPVLVLLEPIPVIGRIKNYRGKINPSESQGYTTAHIAVGAALTAILYAYMPLWPAVTIVLVAVAGTKEFIWDLYFETPEVSGMWWGGLDDWSEYACGVSIACGLLTPHLLHWIK